VLKLRFFFIYLFLVTLGFELRDSHSLAGILSLEPFRQPFFVMDFFLIGSLKLFAQAGFEPLFF
jgi:hypothetical protein